ncbi:cytosolic leucyl tRNA synthetase [Coemansia thaxteri]|uniref:Cytosolic leucyl tRNA synthetase n=1 Tax=Coemansia thaxteri TaxID=2663907 RepID=A0A9W8EGU4_9FUNG|nr:cytosolic leucyl tRNA synthetase [Coemansia thaxteri]
MGNSTSIVNARWPADLPAEANHALIAVGEYIRKTVKSIRDAETALQKRDKKKAAKDAQSAVFSHSAPKTLDIFVANKFPQWQEDVIEVLKECFDAATLSFDDKALKATLGLKGLLKNKMAMPFAQDTKKRVALMGPVALNRALTFKEIDVLSEAAPYLAKTLGYSMVTVVDLGSASDLSDAAAAAAASSVPGEPSFLIANAQ